MKPSAAARLQNGQIVIAKNRDDPALLSQSQAFARVGVVPDKVAQVDDLAHIFCRQGMEHCFKGFLIAMDIRKNGNPSHFGSHSSQ